jgi:hypothetical protein
MSCSHRRLQKKKRKKTLISETLISEMTVEKKQTLGCRAGDCDRWRHLSILL